PARVVIHLKTRLESWYEPSLNSSTNASIYSPRMKPVGPAFTDGPTGFCNTYTLAVNIYAVSTKVNVVQLMGQQLKEAIQLRASVQILDWYLQETKNFRTHGWKPLRGRLRGEPPQR